MFRSRPDTASGAAPVFIFAACWRSGSTLLQRLINASGRVFIWGEPRYLKHALALQKRIDQIAPRAPPSGDVRSSATGQWIPTLAPGRGEFRAAYRSFFETLYRPGVERAGFPRWGFKEVRPGGAEFAHFMHTIFPDAKIVFLVRDPLPTYRSIKNQKFSRRFKDPFAPVNMWANNVRGFLECINEGRLPALLIRHEDLVDARSGDTETLRRLCDHILVPLTDAMLQELHVRPGATIDAVEPTTVERQRVQEITAPLAATLGYRQGE